MSARTAACDPKAAAILDKLTDRRRRRADLLLAPTPVDKATREQRDADLGDEKFGRIEGQGLDKVLSGWAKQDLPDDELLQRGMDLIEGLYAALG